MSSLRAGDKAPDFTLPSVNGPVTLSSFLGKKTVVLFFYPKDDTPGCTREACDFRDGHGRFVKAGAEVIGVSADSVESHGQFAAKHGLPMTLLSDRDGDIASRYGVKGPLSFIKGRVTFVIDRQGVIRNVYSSQIRFGKHVETALEVVRSLEGEAAASSANA